MLPQLSPELRAKLLQIEEQLQIVMQEYPERIAIERLKFTLALAKFVRSQLDQDATVEQSIPSSIKIGRAPQV